MTGPAGSLPERNGGRSGKYSVGHSPEGSVDQ